MTTPTVGLHTIITNPLSSSYLSYLASIDAWTKVCDQVVVVDGGSQDGSVDFLLSWLNKQQRERLIVISNSESHWGTGNNWSWPQFGVNRQLGFDVLETDWAIHIDADYVIDTRALQEKTINSILESQSDKALLNFWVNTFANGESSYHVRKRPWIMNKSKIKSEKIPIAYGAILEKRLNDYPIHIEETKTFNCPETGVEKSYFSGYQFESQDIVDIECFRYGHSFFSPEQCIEKCLRLEQARYRFFGKQPNSKEHFISQMGFDRIDRFMGKAELLSFPHPSEISRVIERFYNQEMLIGALYKKELLAKKAFTTMLGNVAKVKRKLTAVK